MGHHPTRRAFVSLIPCALALSRCVTTQSQSRNPGPAYRVVEYQSGQKPGTIIILKSDNIWSSCKAVSACTADPTIHLAPGRCTSGKLTPTRFIASTAPTNRTASGTSFVGLHSYEERIRCRSLRPHTNRNQSHRAGHVFSRRVKVPPNLLDGLRCSSHI